MVSAISRISVPIPLLQIAASCGSDYSRPGIGILMELIGLILLIGASASACTAGTAWRFGGNQKSQKLVIFVRLDSLVRK